MVEQGLLHETRFCAEAHVEETFLYIYISYMGAGVLISMHFVCRFYSSCCKGFCYELEQQKLQTSGETCGEHFDELSFQQFFPPT